MIEWRSLQTFVVGKDRKAIVTIAPITSQWVRIEIKPLIPIKGSWYLAGWINPVLVIGGKEYLQQSQQVPMAPSVFKFEAMYPYKIRFKPVPYLPSSIIRIYHSHDT